MDQRGFGLPGRREAILAQDRGDEGTGRTLALGTGDVYGV